MLRILRWRSGNSFFIIGISGFRRSWRRCLIIAGKGSLTGEISCKLPLLFYESCLCCSAACAIALIFGKPLILFFVLNILDGRRFSWLSHSYFKATPFIALYSSSILRMYSPFAPIYIVRLCSIRNSSSSIEIDVPSIMFLYML